MIPRAQLAAWLITAVASLSLGACDRTSPTSPTNPIVTTPTTPGQQRSTGPIAFVSNRDRTMAIYLANADGSGVTRLTAGEQPAWAPGGRKLAFQRAGSIFVIGTDGSFETRVTAGTNPSWSPDGSALVYSSTDGKLDLVNVDGSGSRRVVDPKVWNNESADYGAYWPAWSPDGRTIAFIRASYYDSWALFVVDVDGRTAPRLLAQNTAEKTSWSPDGSRIAFGGAPPGVVRIIDANGALATDGPSGFDPDWTPTGSLILNRFTGPPLAGKPSGSRMRIFLSTAGSMLIPDDSAATQPDYWDLQAVWAR